jgi:hypothetical protein
MVFRDPAMSCVSIMHDCNGDDLMIINSQHYYYVIP